MRGSGDFQAKTVLLVAFVLALTLGGVIWKTQTLIVEDKLAFASDSAMKQVAPLKHLVGDKLLESQRELFRFASSRALRGAGREADFGSFDVIAMMESGASGWLPSWIEKSSNAKPARWPQGQDLTLLKSLPFAKVKDGERFWVRLSDGQGAAIFALLIPVEVHEEPVNPAARVGAEASALPDAVGTNEALRKHRGVIVGFVSENSLSAVTEDYIGSNGRAYIVDDRGYVASHVDKSYAGALFNEDPVVEEIMKGERLVGQGRYKDLDGRSVFTHYERVDHTNLTAIVSIPMKVITGVADQHMQVALMIGVGAGLVGLLVSWFVSASFVAPAATAAMSTPAAPVTAPSAISAPPASVQNENSVVAPPAHERPPPITDNWHHQNSQDLQNERKLAFEAFDKSFATRLRGPILAILGHTQLIKAKSDNSPEIQAHAESVEREARTARETLDRIHILNETNSAPVPTETMDLDDVIAQALIEKDLELQANGISVERSMAMLPRLTGRAEDFQVAIGNVIDNAMESMRERPRRRLVIKTEREEGFAVLSISDTGFGMSRDVQERAFEPFFKNFESPDHLGLGLAFVATVTRRSHGDVSLTSIPGDGTTLKMKFPLPPSQIKEVPQEVITEVAAPATRDMSVPRDLNTPPPLDDSPKPPPLPEETPTITLGGKAPLAGMSATILPPPPSENPVGQADDAGFKVQIRRPKPKG